MSSRTSSDSLGDRFKTYESIQSKDTFIPNLPVCVRLDGRAFHTLTRHLPKPFCIKFQTIMQEVTKQLVREFKPLIAYTQSDEISLIFKNDYYNPLIFNARRDKLNSVLASYATSVFCRYYYDNVDTEIFPSFDSRSFNVPDLSEAVNYLIWRELDASKNSVLSAGYAYFTRDQMFKKNLSEIRGMLYEEKGIIWEDYPSSFKIGSYVQRVVQEDQTAVVQILEDFSLRDLPHLDRIQVLTGEEKE